MMEDFKQAILNTKPSVSMQSICKYEQWESEYSNT